MDSGADHQPPADAYLSVARSLNVTADRPAEGGEGGAWHVSSSDADLILKLFWSDAEEKVAAGAQIANALRDNGYPAPRYLDIGVHELWCFALQERLPGVVPELMRDAHVRRLIELLAWHADPPAAAAPNTVVVPSGLKEAVSTLSGHRELSDLVDRLAEVAEFDGIELLSDGIVHSDFHHRNLLAQDDVVTGVFDWEGAGRGDWRIDLACIAIWSSIVPWQMEPAASQRARVGAERYCPPRVLAYLAAHQVAQILEFFVSDRPHVLPLLLPPMREHILPWLTPA